MDITEDRYDATERWIGQVLLAGLLLAIVVMTLGLVLVAARGGSSRTVLPLDRVVPQFLAGSAPAVLDAGILLLFATPLAGVVAALIGYAAQRNLRFVTVTVALLILLALGVVVALRQAQ